MKYPFTTILFLLFYISICIEPEEKIYELNEFFSLIEQTRITEEESKKVIDTLDKILERYVYLDILKNPPQPHENYHNVVYLKENLKNVNTSERSLYNFYSEVKAVIDNCQDLHLSFDVKRVFGKIDVSNSYFISPIILNIDGSKNKVYASTSDYKDYFGQDIINIISQKYKEGNPIKTINGLPPLDFILKYNRNFRKLKSPQAQFVYNMMNMNGKINILLFPFSYNDLPNIQIEYYNNEIKVEIPYKVSVKETNQAFTYKNLINQSKLNHFFAVPFQKRFLLKSHADKLNDDWDKVIKNDKNEIFAYKVDKTNFLNVIFQQTFDFSDDKLVTNFLDECFNKFDDNNFPIIIIEHYNNGGYKILADYFASYIIESFKDYGSFRYSEDVKNNIAKIYKAKDLNSCESKSANNLFNLISDDYGLDKNNNKINHKRTKIADFNLSPKTHFYNYRKNAKNIRKPTEILIFTDGFSYSGGSTFIKKIQLKGGAIIVGYSGSPNINKFDASQSPSSVADTEDSKDDLSKQITNLGFSLSYTIIEYFDKSDIENGLNIPLEFQIHEIDERFEYYPYDTLLYSEFISKAQSIFKKYQTNCNPKNKKLVLISENCKFSSKEMHGGYECGDDGKWSNKCVPTYCDNGFYFDETKNECIKDLCIKYEEKVKTKISKYTILTYIFGALSILFLIIYIPFACCECSCDCAKVGKYHYLLIPFGAFLIAFFICLRFAIKWENKT